MVPQDAATAVASGLVTLMIWASIAAVQLPDAATYLLRFADAVVLAAPVTAAAKSLLSDSPAVVEVVVAALDVRSVCRDMFADTDVLTATDEVTI